MEEEKKEEEVPKKKNPIGKIILVSLLMIGCFCGGYFINENDILSFSKDKMEKQKDKDVDEKTIEEEDKSEEKKVDFSESSLEKYVNYIIPVSNGPSALLFNTSSVDANKLTISDKISYIGSYLFGKASSSSNSEYSILTESDVKSAVEEVYGPNTYEKTIFNLGCGDYTLNENDGKYYSKTGCGGTSVTFDANTIIDYKATTKKLEIVTAYVIYDAMRGNIYKDYDKTMALDNYSGAGNTEEINSYLKEYAKTHKDNLFHITYTFESVDGVNYYFKGFVNNK